MSNSTNNKAGEPTTEAFIEHKVDIFERRFGGFIATESKREKQDNDNDWLRKALQEAIAYGRREGNADGYEDGGMEGYEEGKRVGARREREAILAALPETAQAYDFFGVLEDGIDPAATKMLQYVRNTITNRTPTA